MYITLIFINFKFKNSEVEVKSLQFQTIGSSLVASLSRLLFLKYISISIVMIVSRDIGKEHNIIT